MPSKKFDVDVLSQFDVTHSIPLNHVILHIYTVRPPQDGVREASNIKVCISLIGILNAIMIDH